MQGSSHSTRDGYWDTVKALLIFFVVLGHVVQFFMYQATDDTKFWSDPLFKGIYIFHMPLFMLISGFFAAKSLTRNGKQSIIRYLSRLALPCVGMGLIFLIFVLLKRESIWRVYGGCTVLWFLIVVFECFVFYCFLLWKKSWWYKIILFILPMLLAIISNRIPCISLIWPHTNQFTYLWPIFVLGASLSHLDFSPQQIDKKWIIFPILYVAVFFWFDSSWYVYVNPLTFNFDSLIVDIYRTIAAVIGCGAVLWAGKYIHALVGKIEIIQKIGRATLAIYVLQTIFFLKYKLIAQLLPRSMGYCGYIVLSIFILAALYLIYSISRRIPFVALLVYGEVKRK